MASATRTDEGRRSLGSAAPEVGSPLSAGNRRTLEAVLDRLIPEDDGRAGARTAGVIDYLDRALGAELAPLLVSYEVWLAAIDAHARRTADRGFDVLEATAQDEVLTRMAAGEPLDPEVDLGVAFETIRGHALEGFLGDPSLGGNQGFAGWDLVGYVGPRLSVSAAEQELDVEVAPIRRSAADYGFTVMPRE